MSDRKRRSILPIIALCACLGSGITGCQSWNNGGYPLQSITRVPPPGTGSYELPSKYYNGAGGTNAISQAGTGGMSPVGSSLVGPAANNSFVASGSVANASYSQQQSASNNFRAGAVEQASYVAPVTDMSGSMQGMSQGVSQGSSQGSNSYPNTMPSNSPNGSGAFVGGGDGQSALNWQQ